MSDRELIAGFNEAMYSMDPSRFYRETMVAALKVTNRRSRYWVNQAKGGTKLRKLTQTWNPSQVANLRSNWAPWGMQGSPVVTATNVTLRANTPAYELDLLNEQENFADVTTEAVADELMDRAESWITMLLGDMLK